LTSYY